MRRIVLNVTLVLAVALPAPSLVGKPVFAGWVRSATGLVMVRAGANVTTLDSHQVSGRRLYAGQEVRSFKGTVTLLIYGREFQLSHAQGWYSVPDDAKKVLTGQDVYAKYILRAGRTRDSQLAERLWQAVTLADLTNIARPANYAVHVRLTPAKDRYRVGDQIGIEIKNYSEVPLYISVFDIDCEGYVARIVPYRGRKERVPAHSAWTRVGNSFRLALPAGWKEGTEKFKVIATTKPVDLSNFDSDNRVRHDETPDPALDPLAYMIRTLTGGKAEVDPGAWVTTLVQFTIRK